MTVPDIKDVERDDRHWLVTFRREHELDEIDAEFMTAEAIDAIAQGAEVRRGSIDGQAAVYQVRVPGAMGRNVGRVRTLARDIARRVD